MRWYGVEGDFNVLVMDLLGPSLEDLFNDHARKFSLKTTLVVAEQLVETRFFALTIHFLSRDRFAHATTR